MRALFFERLEHLDAEADYELRHPDYVMEMPQSGERIRGRDAMRLPRARGGGDAGRRHPPKRARPLLLPVRQAGRAVILTAPQRSSGQAINLAALLSEHRAAGVRPIAPRPRAGRVAR